MSSSVVVGVLIPVYMHQLPVLSAAHVLDQHHVQRRRELPEKTQQPHPHREVPE